jgi:hypothetical protein
VAEPNRINEEGKRTIIKENMNMQGYGLMIRGNGRKDIRFY